MAIPRVAAQLYTLRAEMDTPAKIAAGLKRLKDMGYKAVQVSGIGKTEPIDPHALKDLLDENGLEVCCTHIGFGEMENNPEAVVERHKLWGCKYPGIGGMPQECRDSAEGFQAFAKRASAVAKRLADDGLQFIYHNHSFEFTRFGKTNGMEILLNETDPDYFQFELDTYWVQYGGADPVDWIHKVAGRMKVIHFKDMAFDPEEKRPIMAEIGEGNLNWPGIIAACQKTGVEWAPIEQDVCQRSPFESLEISLNNLQGMGLNP